MLIDEIIRKAIPDANDDVCHHILWGRTAYPFKQLSARELYEAADRFKRASANHRRTCDFCDNLAVEHDWLCPSCLAALS
jgi:hypothetical protein